MASRKPKAETDKCAVQMREIQASCPENKKCFECDQRGPTYVDMTVGSFVCTKCSGMLRGITPPHRIKSISMSSFTSEEVEFIRQKGNTYCSKVWMGLYDRNRSGGNVVDLKDDESIKDFIVQKYEKKRYYVDPSTIKHSVNTSSGGGNGSATQVAMPATNIQSSSRPSGMIGTTIQLHGAKKGHSHNSLRDGGPAAVATKPSKPSLNSAALVGLALPSPAVDPFAPSATSLRDSSSAASFTTTKNNSDLAAVFSTPASAKETATKPGPFEANFADFDSANFGSIPKPQNPISQPPIIAAKSTSTALATANETSTEKQDKYAALKNLDDIFKSTGISSDGQNGKSVGSSIFASSSNNGAIFPSPGFGVGGDTATGSAPTSKAVPQSGIGVGGGQQFNSVGGVSNIASSTGWATSWPQATDDFPLSSAMNNGNEFNRQKKIESPINPFIGAANLSQLNTSPWPTTGTSPVQATVPEWPSAVTKNDTGTNPLSSLGTLNDSSTKFSNNHFTPPASGTSSTAPFSDPFDAAPTVSNFHQAPSDKTNGTDLFANAPFTASGGSDIEALTADIFKQFSTTNGSKNQQQSNGDLNWFKTDFGSCGVNDIRGVDAGRSQLATDPWSDQASTSSSVFGASSSLSSPKTPDDWNVFTGSMVPVSNPKNPFL